MSFVIVDKKNLIMIKDQHYGKMVQILPFLLKLLHLYRQIHLINYVFSSDI